MTHERQSGSAGAALSRLVGERAVVALSPTIAALPQRSRLWLVAALSVLSGVFLGLVAYVVLHPLPPVVVANATTDAKLSTPPTPDPTIPIGSQAMWAFDPVEPSPTEAALADPGARVPVGPRVRRERSPRVEGITTPPPPKNDDVPIECVLDPLLPKCGAKTQPLPGKGPVKADAELPNILSQSALRAGVAPVKAAAKTCGAKHGAKPGEKVLVKLSVAGATGAVTSTTAEPPHRGTPLGNCTAAALKKATFAKFKKPVIGLVYTITM